MMPDNSSSPHLLVGGHEIRRGLLRAIEQGKKEIGFQVMIFQPDRTGFEIARALASSASTGTRVILSFDFWQSVPGLTWWRFAPVEGLRSLQEMGKMLSILRKGGVEVVNNPVRIKIARAGLGSSSNKPPSSMFVQQSPVGFEVDHRKVLLVDGEVAIVGGANVGDQYLAGSGEAASSSRPVGRNDDNEPGWMDLALILYGEKALQIREIMVSYWERLGKGQFRTAENFQVRRSGSARPLVNSPQNKEISAAVFQTVLESQESLDLLCPYCSYKPFIEIVKNASLRGVRVRWLFPGKMNDSKFHKRFFHAMSGELLESGVQIYEINDRMIHGKALIVDGRHSLIGSFNLNYRSFVHDWELSIMADDVELALAIRTRVFDQLVGTTERLWIPYSFKLPPLSRLYLHHT